ncbi:MAG: kelch repeat-containing protein, partial [Steroidobacteraceae bacterium]
TDSRGNLWLFGGLGVDSAGTSGFLSDLWEYSISSGDWIWVHGPIMANVNGTYGTKGAAAAANTPGARAEPFRWYDASGHLWLFGGFEGIVNASRVEMNDLWEYPTQ